MNQQPENAAAANQQAARRRAVVGMMCLVGFFVMASILIAQNGCQRPATLRKSSDSDPTTNADKKDPWETIAIGLRKDTSLATCQLALRTLDQRLQEDQSLQKPASLTPENEKSRAVVPLNPEDREEISGWGYSTHDAAYLEECLYFRDVAQSLRLPNLTPAQLADLSFDWVCRSVTLNPLVVPEPSGAAPAVAIPPSYVLRRGSGSGLERMYVFLALMQQLDLDACLIGPPDAGEVGSWNTLGRNRQPVPGGPPRPFWGVGVRLDKEIKVYDPWRGLAYPATLSQFRQKPESIKDWLSNSSSPSLVTVDELKAATVHLAVPVNSLSPRMETLQDKLKDAVGVKLAINPTALLTAFPDPKPPFWNPPADRCAYGRTARKFLPRDLGGMQEESALYRAYLFSQLPSGLQCDLPELKGREKEIATNRIFVETYARYNAAFIQATNPRERIQRGRFQEAITDLISKRDAFNRQLEFIRNTKDADRQIAAWCQNAKQAYQNLGSTILVQGEERETAKTLAQKAIDDLWGNQTTELMLNKVAAPICKSETLFLLGLCKHEIAERVQTRAEHAAGEEAIQLKEQAAEAWREARNAWRTYLDADSDYQRNIPGRSQQAGILSERAEKLAGPPPAKP